MTIDMHWPIGTPEDTLCAIMPRLKRIDPILLTEHVNALAAAAVEFDIVPVPRFAAFLAQVAHETGELRWMTELWGPTPDQIEYSPPGRKAEQLGNTEPEDGKRYRGRGALHITGKFNYEIYGRQLGIDLVAHPERAADIDVAYRIGGAFWKRMALNPLADKLTKEDFRTITRRINGGVNGLAEREKYYAVSLRIFGRSLRG
jgi:putative chitinase